MAPFSPSEKQILTSYYEVPGEIVEDDEDARSNMIDILSLDDYTVETANHCLPAIEAVERRKGRQPTGRRLFALHGR